MADATRSTSPIGRFVDTILRAHMPDSDTGETDSDADQQRRSFIRAMMEAHPEAFQGEADMHFLMYMHPSKL